jgi:hypothetical protein
MYKEGNGVEDDACDPEGGYLGIASSASSVVSYVLQRKGQELVSTHVYKWRAKENEHRGEEE